MRTQYHSEQDVARVASRIRLKPSTWLTIVKGPREVISPNNLDLAIDARAAHDQPPAAPAFEGSAPAIAERTRRRLIRGVPPLRSRCQPLLPAVRIRSRRLPPELGQGPREPRDGSRPHLRHTARLRTPSRDGPPEKPHEAYRVRPRFRADSRRRDSPGCSPRRLLRSAKGNVERALTHQEVRGLETLAAESDRGDPQVGK
jgi:hypothetical protein